MIKQFLKDYWSQSSIVRKGATVGVLLAVVVLIASVPYVQGVYYKTRQKVRDARYEKELGKLKLENDKLQKENSSLKDEIRTASAALESKAKATDERAKEILRESAEDRARIEAQYEKDKQQLETMANGNDCERCFYICNLYERNNMPCPINCAESAECERR